MIKKSHVKKLSASLLAGTMALSILSGCGSGAEKAPEKKTADDAVTLSIAIQVDKQEAFEDFFAAFEKENPNIKIDFLQYGGTEENSFIQSRLASDTLPDLIGISAGTYGSQLADEGILYDLSDSVAAGRMLPSALESYTSPGGSVYGITYGLSTTVLYYNADLFDELGLEVPTNWDEFLDVCEALKASGHTPLALAPADGSIGNTMWSYGFGNNMAGKEWKADMREGKFNFRIPEVEDIFAKTKALNDAGYLQNGAVSADYNAANELFAQGQTAMLFAGIWFNSSFTDTGFKVSAALPPLNDAGKEPCTVVATETSWAVNAKSEHLDEALLLLDFFTGDGYPILQNARMSVPAVKDQSSAVVNDIVAGFMPNFDNATVTAPLYYEYLPAIFQSDLCKTFQDLINNNFTPAQAAEKCQALYDGSF